MISPSIDSRKTINLLGRKIIAICAWMDAFSADALIVLITSEYFLSFSILRCSLRTNLYRLTLATWWYMETIICDIKNELMALLTSECELFCTMIRIKQNPRLFVSQWDYIFRKIVFTKCVLKNRGFELCHSSDVSRCHLSYLSSICIIVSWDLPFVSGTTNIANNALHKLITAKNATHAESPMCNFTRGNIWCKLNKKHSNNILQHGKQ